MRQYLVWFLWFLLGFGIIFGSRKMAMSFPFRDETDHTAVGHFLFADGLKLYQDVISIHQPLPILMGGAISQFLSHSTLFSYISQLRFVMSLFWFAGGTFLVYRFGWRGLATGLGLGVFSFAYFGWYVLAESLVVAPVAAMVFLLFERVFAHKTRPKWWQERFDWWLFGLSAFWLLFNLLPMAPFIGLAGLVYWLSYSKNRRMVLMHLLAGFLAPTFVLFLLVNPLAWWDQTVMNLVNYWFPATPGVVGGELWDIFLWPFQTAAKDFNLPWVVLSILMLIPPGYFSALKRWKIVGKLALVYFTVSMLNVRTAEPSSTFWQGFHLYPYIAGILAWTAGAWFVLLADKAAKNHQRLLSALGSLLFALFLYFAGAWLFSPNQRQLQYEIDYLPQQAIINVLNILKQDGDRLWTGPDGYGYLNVLADLPFGDKQNFHLPWAFYSPYLKQDFYDTFTHSPPTFVYFNPGADADPYYEAVQQQLDTQYVELISPGGNSSQLWVLRSRAEELPPEIWTRYEETFWGVPEELRK